MQRGIVGEFADMDLHSGGGDINRIRALSHELVGLQPDIMAGSKTKCNTDTFIAEVLQCPRVTSI